MIVLIESERFIDFVVIRSFIPFFYIFVYDKGLFLYYGYERKGRYVIFS